MNRIFIVGCPRSGTTLLETMLSRSPNIHTFPESHLLLPGKLHGFALSAAFRGQLRIRRFQRSQGLPRRWFFAVRPRSVYKRFERLADTLAADAGADSWIEKTPDHVFHLAVIRDCFETPRFIHVVRDGRAVVASLYEVTRSYPREWHGPWSLERCVGHWNAAIRASILEAAAQPTDSAFVRYEELVEHPMETLRRVCGTVGLEFQREMAEAQAGKPPAIVAASEPWKRGAYDVLRATGLSKYRELFTSATRQWIEQSLQEIPTGLFDA